MTSVNLVNLDKAFDLISKAGDIIKSLVDGLAHAFDKGLSGYDEVAARRTYHRLLDIRAKLTAFYRLPNSAFYYNLTKTADELGKHAQFHSKWEDFKDPDYQERKAQAYRGLDQSEIDAGIERAWHALLAYVHEAESGLDELLELIAEERSDFISEKTYDELFATLSQRKQAFELLKKVDLPKSSDELKAIQRISKAYGKMREDLDAANGALARYLKAEYKPTSNFLDPHKRWSEINQQPAGRPNLA